ncbi:MAG: SRPBCC family protein [Rhizobiales bacterium]|nr:SRPBCC family protein [Hyphomicrobiales bacterium]
MKKTKTILLDLSAEQAWDVVGNRFGDVGLWAASLTSSHLNGELNIGTSRVCINKQQEIVEKITMFNPDKMELAYEITSALPAFIKTAKNHWSIKPLAANRTAVTTVVTSDLAWWAFFLTPLMSFAIGNILTKALVELKYWAETGEQHPRKKAYNTKFAQFVPQLN